jgi:hypothetical protein
MSSLSLCGAHFLCLISSTIFFDRREIDAFTIREKKARRAPKGDRAASKAGRLQQPEYSAQLGISQKEGLPPAPLPSIAIASRTPPNRFLKPRRPRPAVPRSAHRRAPLPACRRTRSHAAAEHGARRRLPSLFPPRAQCPRAEAGAAGAFDRAGAIDDPRRRRRGFASVSALPGSLPKEFSVRPAGCVSTASHHVTIGGQIRRAAFIRESRRAAYSALRVHYQSFAPPPPRTLTSTGARAKGGDH